MLARKKSLVGLDIGSTEIKAVELTETGEQIKITGFGSGTIESRDALQDTIADVLRQFPRRCRRQASFLKCFRYGACGGVSEVCETAKELLF